MRAFLIAAGVAAGLMLSAGSASAQNMNVADFLTQADRVPRDARAIASPTARRLMNEVQGGFRAVREREIAARAAGRTPPTCMPERIQLNPQQLLTRFQSIPPARRRQTTVHAAINDWMVERYPCRG